MAKKSKVIATLAIVCISVIVVYGTRLVVQRSRGAHPGKIIPARAKGNPAAPLHIVEYIDFQCPACVKGSLFLKEYVEQYPSRIYLEIKYYPLTQMHRHALRSAVYAECAAQQNKFWPFFHSLLEKYPLWDRMINADSLFKEIAVEHRLNTNRLADCVESEKTKTIIFDEKAEGRRRGVQSTPTYFINGKLVTGVPSLKEELTKYFEEKENTP